MQTPAQSRGKFLTCRSRKIRPSLLLQQVALLVFALSVMVICCAKGEESDPGLEDGEIHLTIQEPNDSWESNRPLSLGESVSLTVTAESSGPLDPDDEDSPILHLRYLRVDPQTVANSLWTGGGDTSGVTLNALHVGEHVGEFTADVEAFWKEGALTGGGDGIGPPVDLAELYGSASGTATSRNPTFTWTTLAPRHQFSDSFSAINYVVTGNSHISGVVLTDPGYNFGNTGGWLTNPPFVAGKFSGEVKLSSASKGRLSVWWEGHGARVDFNHSKEIALGNVNLIAKVGPGASETLPEDRDFPTTNPENPASNDLEVHEMDPGTFAFLLPSDAEGVSRTQVDLSVHLGTPEHTKVRLESAGLPSLVVSTDPAGNSVLDLPKTWENTSNIPSKIYLHGVSDAENPSPESGTLTLTLERKLKDNEPITPNEDTSALSQHKIVEKIKVSLLPFEISYDKAANDPHTPEWGKTDPFDPCATQPLPISDEDKPYEAALVIHHKDVRKEGGEVDEVIDFDVELNLGAGSSITVNWTKVDGPNSGQLLKANSTEAIYRNPTEGGLYQFDLIALGEATRGQIWLPLAGPEIKNWVLSELQWLRQFAIDYRNNMPTTHRIIGLGDGLRVVDFGTMAASADWIGNFTSANSPCGGPQDGSTSERHTLAGVVVERHKLSNLLTAFLAKEITTLNEASIIYIFDQFGTPDGPEEIASYNAGFDLSDDGNLTTDDIENVIEEYGFEMQEANTWVEREWPSTEEPTGGNINRPSSIENFSFD